MHPTTTNEAKWQEKTATMHGEPAPDWCANQAIAEHVQGDGAPLVVQFGSEQCALCPQATLDVDCAMKRYEFKWKYEDAPTSSLAEELDVAMLPALLVFHSSSCYTLYQKLRGTNVAEIIKEHCKPRLVLDEDF